MRPATRVHHPVDLAGNPDVVRDVLFNEGETGPSEQLGDVGRVAGHQVVETDDLVSPVEQRAAQVGPEKAGASRDDDPGHVFSRSGRRRPRRIRHVEATIDPAGSDRRR